MTRFRDIKRKARRRLHSTLAEQVLYVPDLQNVDPVTVTVRLHLSFDALGEVRRAGFAEHQEYEPQAVFMLSEVTPRRGGCIITQDMGVWKLDNTFPPDDITMTAEVVRLSDAQVRGLGWDPDVDWAGFTAP